MIKIILYKFSYSILIKRYHYVIDLDTAMACCLPLKMCDISQCDDSITILEMEYDVELIYRTQHASRVMQLKGVYMASENT